VVWLRVLSRTNSPPRSTPNSFRFRTSGKPRILHYFGANKSFRIRTYGHLSCNPFRMHTYKNTGGGVSPPSSVPCRVSVVNPLLSSVCSLFALFLRPPSFLFSNLEPLSAKHPSGVGVPQHLRSDLRSPVTCATWRLYPLCRQSIAHTSRHRGGVLPLTRFRFLCGRAGSNCLALCFHILTNCFSRNPFSFTTIRIAYGGGGCR